MAKTKCARPSRNNFFHLISNITLLKILLLKLSMWPMGAAIVKIGDCGIHTKYRSLWGKLSKISVTLLQFYFKFSHRILFFLTIMIQTILFNIFTDGKIVIDGKFHNKITKLRQVPLFHEFYVMLACFPFKWNHLTIHNTNLS